MKCDVFEKHGWGAFFAASAPLVAKVALCLRARLVKAASATVSGAYKSADEAHEEAAREVESMVRRMAGDCVGEYARALVRARVLAEGGGGRDGIAYRDAMTREVSRLAQRGLVATSYVRRDGTVINVPVDVGLRRALHAAGRQRRMGYALEVAGETSGLVEVSWTSNARKSHADWQGGVYRVREAREGEDIDRYPDFRKACRAGDPVDGIGGYNCGHKVTAYRPGRKRVFGDPSEETGVSAEEAREAVSRQRRIENAIRKDKREREVLDALGLDTGDVNRRIRARQKRLREHIAANPEVCRRERHRESVYERARKRAGAYGGVHLDGAQRQRVAEASRNGMMVAEPRRARAKGMSKRTEKVDIGFVDSDAYRRAFDFFGDGDLGDVVCEEARRMLKRRSGTTLEDFSAVSLSGKGVVTRLTSSKTSKAAVLTRENVRALLGAKRGDLVTIHNHPESMPPSFQDFKMLLVRSIRYGIIACHDGKVIRYRISDRKVFDRVVALGKGEEIDGFLARCMVYYGTASGDSVIARELERRFGVTYERLD